MAVNRIPSTFLIDARGGIFEHDLDQRQTVRIADFTTTFTDIAVTPTGQVFANSFSAIYDVDIEEGTLSTLVSLSRSANGLASDALGQLYVGYSSADRIDVLNSDTGAVVRTIDLPTGTRSAGDIMIVGDTLYYTSSAQNLLEIDLNTDTVTSTVNHGLSAAYGLHEFEDTLYIFSGDDVHIVDRETCATTLEYTLVQAQFGSVVYGAATAPITRVEGTNEADVIVARFPGLVLDGGSGDDDLQGSNGTDTLIGGTGDDTINAGNTAADLRDVVFGGVGADMIDGGYGNDELRGDAGNDTIAGSFGADTIIGGAGDDVLTGAALGDNLFGGDGDDFINGGFGYDRVNGGAGADEFYHIGIAGHGSDWIQDYNAAEGDVLYFGKPNADINQFQINVATTQMAGDDSLDEAFIVYRPTGQIIWALVDGDGQDAINLRIGTDTFDLMG